MNLKEIRAVLDSGLPDEYQERLILGVLASDEGVIPSLLEILANERTRKKEMLKEINALLSKAHIMLDPKINRTMNKDGFVQKEIVAFYKKNRGAISHTMIDIDKV